MPQGAIHDPLRGDPWRSDVLRRLDALEREVQVFTPSTLAATPLSGAGAPSSDWYMPITTATLGYPGGQPWTISGRRIARTGLWVSIPWRTGAGTTGEVRLLQNYGGGVTSSVALGAASSGTVTFNWLHGVPVWAEHITFYVDARRTAGANNVEIGFPTAAQVDPLGCTTTGV